MFFFPFRVDLELKYIPIATIFVCLLCMFVNYMQFSNEKTIVAASESYCEESSMFFKIVLSSIRLSDKVITCQQFLLEVHTADDPNKRLQQMTDASSGLTAFDKSNSYELVTDKLGEQYATFSNSIPGYLTKELWYHPKSWNPLSMISAVFAHADWKHLVGNLFFFFAFAAAVELIIGSMAFSAVVLGSALFTGIFYSLSSITVGDAAATVGLSGVVMTMLALFVFFLPLGKIRCFFWVIVVFGTVAVPAWILGVWYVGWDLYHLFWVNHDNGVNLVAHISGAAFGYLVGLLWLRERRSEIREMSYV